MGTAKKTRANTDHLEDLTKKELNILSLLVVRTSPTRNGGNERDEWEKRVGKSRTMRRPLKGVPDKKVVTIKVGTCRYHI
jgi:hypothetical protein